MTLKEVTETAEKFPDITIKLNARDFVHELKSMFYEIQAERDAEREAREADNAKGVVTAEEACKILNVTRTTLWRWNRMNYLKIVKIGNKVCYRKADIEKLMK